MPRELCHRMFESASSTVQYSTFAHCLQRGSGAARTHIAHNADAYQRVSSSRGVATLSFLPNITCFLSALHCTAPHSSSVGSFLTRKRAENSSALPLIYLLSYCFMLSERFVRLHCIRLFTLMYMYCARDSRPLCLLKSALRLLFHF